MMSLDTKRKLKSAAIMIAASLIFVLNAMLQVSAQPKLEKVSFNPPDNKNARIEDVPADEVQEEKTSENIKIIQKGIINDEAIYLSQPVYPTKAKAADVKGEIIVEVLINKKGIVTKAKAVSGNPLLRKSAEWAARRSKFKPAEIEGEIIPVKGIIVYNFK